MAIRPDSLRDASAKAAVAKGGNAMKTRLAAGEENNRKRMATLGTLYDPDAGADDGEGSPESGPNARLTRLCGSVADRVAATVAAVFDWAEARDPEQRRDWVVLVDGAKRQIDLKAGRSRLA